VEFINDDLGEKFWIYWDVERFECAAVLHVRYRGCPVGRINSLREEDNSITLADIVIAEQSQLRGRGLGKAMMREFIRWARENKFKEIWGFIQAHDGSTEEYLREWYKRQGFKVYEAKQGVYHILLDFQNENSIASR
jgi:GNAT superfamily N-acetyltransferase